MVNWKCSRIDVFKLLPQIFHIHKGINYVEFGEIVLAQKNHQKQYPKISMTNTVATEYWDLHKL